MPKFFGVKWHKIISPEKIHHTEEGKVRQVKKEDGKQVCSLLELLTDITKRVHSTFSYGKIQPDGAMHVRE